MPTTYYVEVDGRVVGPIARPEVERLLASGQITAGNKARPGYRREWSTVAEALKRPIPGTATPSAAATNVGRRVEELPESPRGSGVKQVEPDDRARRIGSAGHTAVVATAKDARDAARPSTVDGNPCDPSRSSPPLLGAVLEPIPARARRRVSFRRRLFDLPLGVHLVLAILTALTTVVFVAVMVRPRDGRRDDSAAETASNSRPESTRITNSIGMSFVELPEGQFVRGSDRHHDNEKPAHPVTISRPLVIGVHEVTQREFETVMGFNPSKHRGEGHPVDSVAWHQAVEFCERLSSLANERVAGRAYRLPTEAEWEYACRAGATTAWSFGAEDSDIDAYAWTIADPSGTSREVGQKLPNAWGLFDMSGNVGEWVGDRYGTYPNHRMIDPAGPSVGELRVSKGGNFRLDSDSCRPAARGGVDPSAADDATGFRVVLTDGVPEHERYGTEAELRALVGVWQVNLRGGYSGRWTFLADGTCRATHGASSGTWRFESDRVFIQWDNGDAWDAFDRPIDASRPLKGDSWSGDDALRASKR